MIKEGENPKSLVLEECKPHCTYWKDKLTRCETQLEKIIKINPTKTCLYPMRDYATCVEACAQPVIHDQLKGTDWTDSIKIQTFLAWNHYFETSLLT